MDAVIQLHKENIERFINKHGGLQLDKDSVIPTEPVTVTLTEGTFLNFRSNPSLNMRWAENRGMGINSTVSNGELEIFTVIMTKD